MGRLVILVLLVLVVAWWLFHRIGRQRREKPPAQATARPAADAQEMVACAHCGIHVPLKEAVRHGELLYCGESHRLLGPRS